MEYIKKRIERIEDELESAEEYAELYLESKARGQSARASKYYEMSHDELKHAENIYELAEQDIESLRKVFPISVEDEECWSMAKKRMHERIARIRMYYQ